jgi:protocatechuate 3,4-dioxygenase beta subunit
MAHWRSRTHFILFAFGAGVIGFAWYNLRGQEYARGVSDAASRIEPPEIALTDAFIPEVAPAAASRAPEASVSTRESSRSEVRASVGGRAEEARSLPPQYSLTGTVLDVWPSDAQLQIWFGRLALCESEEELNRIPNAFGGDPSGRPAVPEVVVKLAGEAIDRQCVSDAQGGFAFHDLPRGTYELSAERAVPSLWTGNELTARASRGVMVVMDTTVSLELSTEWLAIEGRVTDADGRPIADAKVTAISGALNEFDLPMWEVATRSRADGGYELRPLRGAGFKGAAELLGSNAPARGFCEIRVEAAGFMQQETRVPRVPLMTDEQLIPARRFIEVVSGLQLRFQGRSRFREARDPAMLPKTQGTTILGIDIVMDRLPAGAHVSGRVVDTRGRPAAGRRVEFSMVQGPASPMFGYRVERRRTAELDASGTFELPDLLPGQYSIIVYGPGPGEYNGYQKPVTGETLVVQAGERREDFEIRIHPAEDFAVSGRVYDAKGNPMRRIFVSASISTGFSWWDETDDTGAYRLEGLDGTDQTTFTINFRAQNLSIENAAMNARDVDLVVPETGSIFGAVCSARTGDALTTYAISVPTVRLADGRAVAREPAVQIERFPDGTFMISNVLAGEVTVEIRAEGLEAQRFDVRVEPDKISPLLCAMLDPRRNGGRNEVSEALARGESIAMTITSTITNETGA